MNLELGYIKLRLIRIDQATLIAGTLVNTCDDYNELVLKTSCIFSVWFEDPFVCHVVDKTVVINPLVGTNEALFLGH